MVVVVTSGAKVWWLLHPVPRCDGCYIRCLGVVVVVTPSTKV